MKDKIEQIIDRFRSAFDSEIQIYSMADYIFELETKLQNTSSNSDYAKCKEAYIDGYESGHNDTVESRYGSSDEKADEWISEHFA